MCDWNGANCERCGGCATGIVLLREVWRVCDWNRAYCERCVGCATGIELTARGGQGVRLE